jgi:hypothetical protein
MINEHSEEEFTSWLAGIHAAHQRQHGCADRPTNGGRPDSGQRNLYVSGLIRKVDGVRHMDLDMVQMCSGCDGFELVAEVKDHRAYSKIWRHTQRIGDRLGAPSALVVFDEDTCQLRWETRGC